MEKVFLRAFTKPKEQRKKKKVDRVDYKKHKVIFIFDTETTTDIKQDLKVGFFQIYVNGNLMQEGFFYKQLSNKEKDILFQYARKRKIEVYSLLQFIYQIFFPVVLKYKALCIGFNLPFDISRISLKHSRARRNEKEGFSFKLFNQSVYPRIKIKQFNSETNIIKFGYSFLTKDRFQGYFLDIQKLASVLLENKRISLEETCKKLKTKIQKLKTEEHGKVTSEYLDYLITDVRSTYECYLKLNEEFQKYNINLPINQIYSNASFGKGALRQMGINPFLEQNPGFPNDILGYIMSAYYGGRTECKIRKYPLKVTTLDFTSMYPTLTILMNLWDFVIADRIEYEECTNETTEFLNTLKLGKLNNKEIWKKITILVELEPREYILPVRTKYGEKSNMHTIGINKLIYKGSLWYALPDVISHKILTGKSPKIKRAIKFIPLGKQVSLEKTKILGTDFDPNEDNFIKRLVEERQKLKLINKSKAQALKIMANATTYGIFIQLDPDDEKQELEVYSNKNFFSEEAKWEKQGEFFNPIISVFTTSGARLLLSMAEKFVESKNYNHAYMDTDSIFVKPKIAGELSEFFQPLNPYNKDTTFLKIEKKNKWFYGISSKRYVLYDLKGKEIIIDEDIKEGNYKLHGLGHLTNPFSKEKKNWFVDIWKDILRLHYNQISEKDLIEKYSKFFAISKMTISNQNILNWFKKNKEVQPFNFFLRGIGAKKDVKPITSFSKEPQTKVYEEFVNLETGEVMQGEEYWKTLDKEIIRYIDHKESKFEGDVGLLKRRHLKPKSIEYIGKESNKIKQNWMESQETYKNTKEICQKILNVTPEEARKKGVSRPTLWKIKQKIKKGKKINFKTKSVKRLVS